MNYTISGADREPPNFEHALAELRAQPVWVAWRPVAQSDGKVNKVPVDPKTGRNASSTNPATWGTYEQAVAAGQSRLGFVLTAEAGLTGIDLDDCIREDGSLTPLAQHIVDRAASYTYITPSGRGLRIMVRGLLPRGRAVVVSGLEAYCQGRYFTVGGDQWPGTPPEIRDGVGLLEDLAESLAALQRAALVVQTAEPGDGNNALNREAYNLARAGSVDRDLAEAVLVDAAVPRRDDAEALQTFNSGWAAGERARLTDGPRGAGRLQTTQDYFDALEAAGWSFRLNVMTDGVVTNRGPLTDVLRALIYNDMADQGFLSRLRVDDAVMALAHNNKFHPVCEFLDNLQWDGEDHIGRLLGYMRFAKPEWAQVAFRKWMVGAVARAYCSEQNAMLVLVGAQALGKSRLARFLCPLPELYLEAPIQPDNKDDLIRLAGKWIWEVAELGATTRRADREALKHFITMQEVTVRKPYGREDVVKPALASLVGTVNDDGNGFLNDPTGNRRFWTVELTGLDWAYSQAVDMRLVWAQAVDLYRRGEAWTLTPAEVALRDEESGRFEAASLVEQYFFRCYEVDPAVKTFTATMDILQALREAGLDMPQKAASMELAALLKKLNVEQARELREVDDHASRIRGYKGLKATPVVHYYGEGASVARSEPAAKQLALMDAKTPRQAA